MKVEDLKINLRLSKTTSSEKSLVIRYTNPLTKQRDKTITINWLKLKDDELLKGKLYVDAARYKIYEDIIDSIHRYCQKIDDVYLFREDNLKDYVLSLSPIFKAKEEMNSFIKNIIKSEIEKKKSTVKENTIKVYDNLLLNFEIFEKYTKKQYTLLDFDYQFLIKFEQFLIKDRRLKDSVADNYSYKMRCILSLHFLSKNDIKNLNTIKVFKTSIKKQKSPEKACITFEEMIKIYESDFSDVEPINEDERTFLVGHNLNHVRDFIVIAFMTGQRLSDVQQFINNQVEIRDNKFINLIQKKTQTKIEFIPIYGVLEDLMKRCNYDLSYLQGLKHAQRINQGIRMIGRAIGLNDEMQGEIMKEVEVKCTLQAVPGIESRLIRSTYKRWELLSSHYIGRASFVTHQFLKGTPNFIGTTITGHKSMSTYNSYNKAPNAAKLDLFEKLVQERDKYVKN